MFRWINFNSKEDISLGFIKDNHFSAYSIYLIIRTLLTKLTLTNYDTM